MFRSGVGFCRRALVLMSLGLWLGWLGPGAGLVQAKPAAAILPASVIAKSELPREGRDTMALIHKGGPFPYHKDGTVFGNRERLLPAQTRGYYREYTVETPRQKGRGARRIVCGGLRPVAPDACFYTDDHYASFRQIVQSAER